MNHLKKMLYVLLISMLALNIATAQEVGNYVIDYAWNWDTDYEILEFDENNNPINAEYKVYNENYNQSPLTWTYGVGEGQIWRQSGTVLASDPWVRQTILNNSSANWSDWHVRITGGFITFNSIKVYNRTLGETNGMWVWTDPGDLLYDSNGKIIGFNAHTVTGSGKHVLPGQLLRVEFYYEAYQVGQSVTIEQYPTDSYPIPEPGTIVALASGLAGFGIFTRRKIR